MNYIYIYIYIYIYYIYMGGVVVMWQSAGLSIEGTVHIWFIACYPTFAHLSEETLKAGDLFCLVSMPGGVKALTQGVNV